MTTREIRRRCRDLVRTLDIPSPFDVQQFCAALAARRGRSIDLRPLAMPSGGPCGLFVSTAGCDYIFYEERTTGLHREHIIMHEIGHLLSDHGGEGVLTPTATELLLPHLDPALVSRVLNRTEYSVEEERTAETVASMILERANRWKPVSQWAAPAHGAEVRRRVGETFEPASDRRRP
jgi:hypothetical protein